MPFSHSGLSTTTGIYRYIAVKPVSQVNKYTLSYRFLNGNVHGCVFAKNRPVSLNWSDYKVVLFQIGGTRECIMCIIVLCQTLAVNCKCADQPVNTLSYVPKAVRNLNVAPHPCQVRTNLGSSIRITSNSFANF